MSAFDPKRTLGYFCVGSEILACLPQIHRSDFGDGRLHYDLRPAAVADQRRALQTLTKQLNVTIKDSKMLKGIGAVQRNGK